jgi:hypothetical protein
MTQSPHSITLFQNRPEPAVGAYSKERELDRRPSPRVLVRRSVI